MLSFEVALPVGAIALYLYDCSVLLFGNELVYIRDSGRWKAAGGFDLFVFGKRVCLPSPLAPRALIFRVAWSENDARTGVAEDWPQPSLLQALKPLQFIGSALHLMLLLLLPLLSIFFGAGLLLLGLFGAFYLLTVSALIVAWRRREMLGLRGKAFWMLALDVIACPPFAVNMVRKITLPLQLDGNPLAFAHRVFAGPERRQLIALLRARVDELLASRDPQGESAIRLTAFRDQLIRDGGI